MSDKTIIITVQVQDQDTGDIERTHVSRYDGDIYWEFERLCGNIAKEFVKYIDKYNERGN